MSLQKDPAIAGRMLEERSKVKIRKLGKGMVRAFRARDFDECCMEALSKDPNAFLV